MGWVPCRDATKRPTPNEVSLKLFGEGDYLLIAGDYLLIAGDYLLIAGDFLNLKAPLINSMN
jgi:hypothetical protein